MNMLNANTAIKKRGHAELTVPQKQEIIDYKKKFPKLTQKELIEKFSVEYKTVIPKNSVTFWEFQLFSIQKDGCLILKLAIIFLNSKS